ncbi:MAG: LVIVD repeat-containing protein, partial [Steroidobacterales bacterium]
DSVTPGNAHYNAKAARAKLMARDPGAQHWGADVAAGKLAHGDDNMECYACHTSWTPSCGGCHLPIEANWKTAAHRYEGETARNYATYNPEVARDDIFMLGRRGATEGGKIAPLRSSSALVLSSTNANRERIYIQQPPIAASGFSSQAMNPHYPHTERKTETKQCSDCHLAATGDNNAIVAQTLAQGTQFVNLVGFNAWVGTRDAVTAVQVTEWEEPQAVIGSYLQRYAYPDFYRHHLAAGRKLQHAESHRSQEVGCLQLRGEYLYVAARGAGLRVYDVASIANKAVSQKIVTAPFSPLGHDTHVPSRDASCVALATTQPVHPARNQGSLMRVENLEQPFLPVYDYALVTDREEGLILVDINTLMDGELRNNFLKRALTWNEGGVLKGARHLTVAGSLVYVMADAGLVALDLADPLHPQWLATVPLRDGRASMRQFRYLFATDAEGLKVIDVTQPRQPRLVAQAVVPLSSAGRLFVSRTFAYVANGPAGLAIVDIERPEAPRLDRVVGSDEGIVDARDVVVASTNASLFAYVADGRAGLKVLQLTAPDTQPNFYGFSPEPKPHWIAQYPTSAPALALSRPLERDRAVDETGGQIAVFGRRGARPLTLEEMQGLYLDGKGQPWYVHDDE